MTQAIAEQLDKEIRKQIESDVKIEEVTAKGPVSRICYSKADKESNTGIMHNARIILMFAPQSLGYMNKLDDKLKLPLADKPPPMMKKKVGLQQITLCRHTEKSLSIKYKENDSEKSWSFKFPSDAMASKWEELINAAIKEAINPPKSIVQVQKLTPTNQQKEQNTFENPLLQSGNLVGDNTDRANSPDFRRKQQPGEGTSELSPMRNLQGSSIGQSPEHPGASMMIEESPQTRKQRMQELLNQELERMRLEHLQKRKTVLPDKLEEARLNWNYRYYRACGNSQLEHILLQDFNKECTRLCKDIINELSLPKSERKYQPKKQYNLSRKYIVDSIKFVLHFSTLIDKPGMQPIYDSSQSQSTFEEFENSKYIFQHCQPRREHSIGVPLSCVIRYRGITVFCKSQLLQQAHTIRLDDEKLKQCLNSLSGKTHVDGSIYESMDVSKVDYSAYVFTEDPDVVAGTEFIVYYLEDISFYLPGELPKPIQGRRTLRPELLLRSEFSEKMFKGQPQVRIHKDIKTIETASSRIQSIAEYIVDGLECRCLELSNELYVSNQREFRELLNYEGLRLEHIPLLLARCRLAESQKMCNSQLATAAFETIICSNIQQITLEEGTTQQQCLEMVIDLLNAVLGSSTDSQLFWQIASHQCLHNFGLELNSKNINKHYLMVSLAESCGLSISEATWKHIQYRLEKKEAQGILLEGQLAAMEAVVVDSYPSKLELDLQKALNDRNHIRSVASILQQIRKIPSSPIIQKRKRYLIARFPEPDQEETPASFITIPRPFDLMGIHTVFYELAWASKAGNTSRVLSCFKCILEALTTTFGDYHPLHSRLFRLLVQNSQRPEEYGDAITMAKSEVVNSSRVFGHNHAKTASAYLSLGRIFLKSNNQEQCLQTYRQACSILQEAVNSLKEESFEIQLLADSYMEAADLMSSNNQLNDQFERYCKYASDFYESRLSSAIVPKLCRVYNQLYWYYVKNDNKSEVQEVVACCMNLLPKIAEPADFERAYKLVLQEILVHMAENNKHTLREIIEQLVKIERRLPVVEMYSEGYRLLKRLLIESKFKLNQIMACTTEMQRHYNQIMQGNMIPTTKAAVGSFGTIDDVSLVLTWTVKGWLEMFGKEYLYGLLAT